MMKIGSLSRIAGNWWMLAVFSSLTLFPVTSVVTTQLALAQARIPVNSALRLYGNAVNSGLCKTLSPATQNLWVCELTDSDPDVHLTFNVSTDLHITVRTPRVTPTCEGKSWLVGNWPNGLTLNQHEQTEICNVNLIDYVARLNSVPEEFTNCIEAFTAAQERGRISPSVATSYIDQCRANTSLSPKTD